MKQRGRGALGVLGTLGMYGALVAAIVSLLGCSRPVEVRLEVQKGGGGQTMELRGKNCNGFVGIQIWNSETLELKWSLNLESFPGGTLVYGVPPQKFRIFTGEERRAKQSFPARHQKAPPLEPNSHFFATVVCQYDEYFGACITSFDFLITTDAKGAIHAIKRISRVPDDKQPKRSNE